MVTNILMYNVVSEVIETEGIGEGFAAGLHGEGGLHITQRQSLTIDSADGHGPSIVAVLRRNRTVSATSSTNNINQEILTLAVKRFQLKT